MQQNIKLTLMTIITNGLTFNKISELRLSKLEIHDTREMITIKLTMNI